MKNIRWIGTSIVAIAILLGGCAEPQSSSYNAPVYRQGVVDRIEIIKKGDTNNIAGTIIGGIAGGLIGHQIGGGSGQTAATIIGGFGSVPGAVLGGIIVGLAESLGAAYVSSTYKDALVFLLMVGFLVARPQGLFGESRGDRG